MFDHLLEDREAWVTEAMMPEIQIHRQSGEERFADSDMGMVMPWR